MAELYKTISVIESWLKQPVSTPPPINELYDALELLKEQEPIKPITEHKLFLCPMCKNTLFREQKFCHECGKRIEWEGR